jgi:hypothetical protein
MILDEDTLCKISAHLCDASAAPCVGFYSVSISSYPLLSNCTIDFVRNDRI